MAVRVATALAAAAAAAATVLDAKSKMLTCSFVCSLLTAAVRYSHKHTVFKLDANVDHLAVHFSMER